MFWLPLARMVTERKRVMLLRDEAFDKLVEISQGNMEVFKQETLEFVKTLTSASPSVLELKPESDKPERAEVRE